MKKIGQVEYVISLLLENCAVSSREWELCQDQPRPTSTRASRKFLLY
jgi:hypothetical protein